MAGSKRFYFGLLFALLAISLDFRLNFAMPLQEESYRQKTENLYKQMVKKRLNLVNQERHRIAYPSNPWLNPYAPKLNPAKDLIRKPGRLLIKTAPAHNPGEQNRRYSISDYEDKKFSSAPKISPYATAAVHTVPEPRYYSAKSFIGQPENTKVQIGQQPRRSDYSRSNEAALEEQIHKAYEALVLKKAHTPGFMQRSPVNVNPYIATEHALSYLPPASVRNSPGTTHDIENVRKDTTGTKSPWDNIQNINKESKILEQRIKNAYSLLNEERNIQALPPKPEQGFAFVDNDNLSSPLFVDKYNDLSGLSDSTSQDYDNMESQGYSSAVGESSGGDSEQTTKQLPSSQLQSLYKDIMTMNITQNGTLKPESKIQLPGSRRTLTVANALGVFKAALKFADLLHKESSQLESDASGDSVDSGSGSSPRPVEGPDSSTNDVDDAVEAGGDTDNTQDSSKISPNEQTANTANSPAEPATNSEDASVSSGDSSSTNIDYKDTQVGSNTQSSQQKTTAQANQRSDTMAALSQQKTPAQADQPYEASQQSDQATYKFLNGDGEVQTASKNDGDISDQASAFDYSEQTMSPNTEQKSSNFQFDDQHHKVKNPAGEGTPYHFLNANGRIESVDKSEMLAEDEEKPKTLNYAYKTQDQNTADKTQYAPSALDSVSNDQNVLQQAPQNQETLNFNPAVQSSSATAQAIPTQGALNSNYAGQTQSTPETAVPNQTQQNVQYTTADQATSPSTPSLNNAAVQSQNSPEPNQFINLNQNTEKLSYSQQPKSAESPSFEFADQTKTAQDNLNYAEQDRAPQNMNYADQTQATQNYVDQSQSAPNPNQFVDQRQQQTPQNAYYADQSQNLLNSADQSQSFSQGAAIDNHEPESFREIVCKGVNKRISCNSGEQINILNADYGSMGQSECKFNDAAPGPSPTGTCQTPGTYDAVKAKCDGRQSCDLTAADQEFGDACPGDDKYLDVNYGCAAAPWIPWEDFYRYPTNADEESDDSSGSDDDEYASVDPQQFAALMPFQDQPFVPYGGYAAAPAPQPYYPQPALSPYQQQAPAIPNLMTSNMYAPPAPPNPCDPCNTCNMCETSHCASQCQPTCHALQCGPPRLPAHLLPLWQQWDDKTADMNAMEMSALIMSPVPKLSPAKKPEKGSGESGSSSDQEDEDSEKRSEISKAPSKKSSYGSKTIKIKSASSIGDKKTAKASKKSFHLSELQGFRQNDASQSKDTGSGMLESEISQGFLTSNDFSPGSGDTASGSTQ